MNRKSPFVLLLALVMCFSAVSQKRRPHSAARTTANTSKQAAPTKPGEAAAQPAPTPAPAATSDSPTLAVVNDMSFTASDIEPAVSEIILNDPDLYLHDFYQDREKAIREARQRAVDARISSMLITAEAKKRNMTTDAFLDAEVNGKIAAPTDAEVRNVFESNRAQLGDDYDRARPTIINYLRNERAEKARDELVNRLKMTNTVMKGADVNAPNLAPGTVIGSVNGQPLRVETINERMKAYVYKMERRIYEAQRDALDRRINNTLITAEANKKNIGSEQVFRTEVTDKVKPPTDAEISKFYEENKSRINGDLASSRSQIAEYLAQQQQQKLEQDLATRLRAGAKVQDFLKEPAPPVFNVAVGKGYGRGDINSTVKIVEFTDFQCSACGGMYPVIEDVLKSYGNRVYFEMRNFPLTSVHENAFAAAGAAAAANAQGKLWPYIDFLFKNQTALDADSLKKYATQVGLDRKRFDADFESGKFDADIRRDIEEGEIYGIEGTPTIFINGVMLTTLSADGLREAIEKALARAPKN
ncbi:MAG TPA: thioredoxin domain-containing protein [Pyrinomonadaceae bacterium]